MVRALPLLLLLAGPLLAADPPPGKLWAILIATTKHTHKNKPSDLLYCEDDVTELRRVLLDRGQDVTEDRILTISDQAKVKPTKKGIEDELAEWLNKPAKEDRVLVFFAGHGELSKTDKKTYLLPSDVDLDDLEGTALPLSGLREQLNKCKAKTRWLILDCCHAGNARAATPAVALPARAVAEEFKADELNTVVLAGANDTQSSWPCNRLRHGIFTYWLCRGLEGAAADDKGESITLSKLNEYVHDRTKRYAAMQWNKDQTPVMFGKIAGEPVLLTLKPELPETLCRRMAAHLDLEIRQKKLKGVAVAEFLFRPFNQDAGLSKGNLGGYTAGRVREALRVLATAERETEYVVLDADTTTERLAKLPVAKLGTPDLFKTVRVGKPELDTVVTGVIEPDGNDLLFTCRLYGTADGKKSEPFVGKLPLSEDLVADLGGHLNNKDRPKGSPHDKAVVEKALEKAEGASPLKPKEGEKFLFPVEVWGKKPGEKEEWVKKEWRYYLPEKEKQEQLVFGVATGEQLKFKLWNLTGNDVGCQFQLDGLNTIEQTQDRVGLGRLWVLPPVKEPTDPPSHTIEGWTFPNKDAKRDKTEDTKTNPFVIVDAAESVAGRQRFGEKIGSVTAAFFYEQGRAVGVGEGAAEVRPLKVVNFKPGRLAAVVQLRYVDEKELK